MVADCVDTDCTGTVVMAAKCRWYNATYGKQIQFKGESKWYCVDEAGTVLEPTLTDATVNCDVACVGYLL